MYKFSDDTIETLDVKLGTRFPELQGKWSKEFGTLRYEFIKASVEDQKIILKALVNNIKSADLLQMMLSMAELIPQSSRTLILLPKAMDTEILIFFPLRSPDCRRYCQY